LIAEHCPDANIDSNQITSINTQQDSNKVLAKLHLTAKLYHKRTTPVVCKIDTGAELNVLSKQEYDKIVPNPKQRELGPPQFKITAWWT